MNTRLHLLCATLVLSLAACGGDDDKDPTGPGPSGTDPYYLRGKIDGAAWSAPGLPIGVTHALPGQYILIAQPTGTYRLEIDLSNITGPGTFPLGVSAMTRGGTVTLSLQPRTWLAPLTGASGSITFATLSDTLMAGTLSFTANEVGGSTTRTLTEGEFRLRVNTIGSVGPVLDSQWSEVRGTINGSAWNASHVATLYTNNTLTVSASNATRVVSFTFSEVNGPGEYHLSTAVPIRTASVQGDGVEQNVCCWGPYDDASATLTIDSLTGNRVVGQFEASLKPAPGSRATGTTEISFTTLIAPFFAAP